MHYSNIEVVIMSSNYIYELQNVTIFFWSWNKIKEIIKIKKIKEFSSCVLKRVEAEQSRKQGIDVVITIHVSHESPFLLHTVHTIFLTLKTPPPPLKISLVLPLFLVLHGVWSNLPSRKNSLPFWYFLWDQIRDPCYPHVTREQQQHHLHAPKQFQQPFSAPSPEWTKPWP